ncbi:MAG: DUF3786 domain-containing protein [Desulforhabdus sp.]|nr:DUF3786 domain-containing protein [Desulforhabdus sp.]
MQDNTNACLDFKVLTAPTSMSSKGRIETRPAFQLHHPRSWKEGCKEVGLIQGIKGRGDWGRLFGQRCEKPLKRLVDTHTDLFEEIIDIFDGKLVENDSECDISAAIHPLPGVNSILRSLCFLMLQLETSRY